jgi:DNA polymerase
MTAISIDFETYSECDIRSSGAYAYADHPTTEVLCLAWAVEDQQPVLWIPSDPAPAQLFKLIEEGAEVWAWNSFFETCVWNLVLGWPEVPFSQWRDTAALAAAQAYPRALGACGEFMGMEGDQAKNKRGRLLIQRLCKPYRGARLRDATLLRELYDYCLQDVVAEREIRKRLRPLRPAEQRLWEIDQAINWRGVRLDLESIRHALALIEQVEQKLNAEVPKLTGYALDSTASRAKALDWIAGQGYRMQGYTKQDVELALQDPACPARVRRFLEIRQQLSKSSTKKYQAMAACAGRDGRAHGVLVYHGAATGRWSGRLVQPQNLPRPTVEDVGAAIEAMALRKPQNLPGEPMEVLSSCLRGMLTASRGHRLIVCDFASIEARTLAWMANHEPVLDAFRQGLDIYKVTAAAMFGVDYHAVDKNQRFLGKVATLALGYQGGVLAFSKMAKNYGTDVDEATALKVRDDWRASNKPIVSLWHEVEEAALRAVAYGNREATRCGDFMVIDGDLLFKLPSGRVLSFPKAQLRGARLVYQGNNNHTHRWGTIEAYGGSLVQSITQAIARDLLAAAVVRVEEAGYPVVLTVHDEIVSDAPAGHGSLEEFEALMCQLPAWAEGLPVSAEGYVSLRYRK